MHTGRDLIEVLEEGLETILLHWGHKLLTALGPQVLGHSGSVTREQALLAGNELGRIHIFELKRDTADAAAMFQIVSYVVIDQIVWRPIGRTELAS